MSTTSETSTESPDQTAQTAEKPATGLGSIGLGWIDDRLSLGGMVKFIARKIFPDHWSFMLGEVAMYSFVVLLISGTFLTMFFVPSAAEVTYDGPFAAMQGVRMSEAYESTLHLSFEVRGGLLFRQIHHWAALIFMVAIFCHMFRVFFTGAFRKPREINWLIGFMLMVLGMLAGFSGYSLPDDVLSGNGLRIADGVAKAIPLIGTYVSFYLFGGEFPGHVIIPRLFTVHILLIPALILLFLGAHLIIMVVQKHTQYPGPGRTNKNVVGYPVFPVYLSRMGGFFFIVFGVIVLIAATTTINPVWNYGPYDPSPVSAGAQPDWYMLFMEGGLRLMPGWGEFYIGGWPISLNILIPGVVVPGILFGFLALYPFIESWITGDTREHHILDRPRNAPVRTGLGMAWIVAYVVLALAGSNDVIATHFHLSLNDITYTFRVGIFLFPIIAFIVTKRFCISLQRADREKAVHGRETGRLVRALNGKISEIEEPLSDYDRWTLVQAEPQQPLPAGKNVSALRARLTRFYFRDQLPPVTRTEVLEAQRHLEHEYDEYRELGIDPENSPELPPEK